MKNNRDLQAYFNRQLLKILKKHGKKMIGWDEILHPDLPKDIAVQSWRGQASLAEGARQGYKGILSYGYYLDHMRPASFHYQMDPLGKEAADLTEQQQAYILGGEACMWAEFVNPDNIESRIWPRAAAIAERLWSPASAQNIQDMYGRLQHMDRELAAFGSMHQNNYIQMLQRMAGSFNVSQLKSFADLLKATSLSVRQRTSKYYSYTPMNRLADTVMPESFTALNLERLVDIALFREPLPTANQIASQSESDGILRQIRERLTVWRDQNSGFNSIIHQSFLLEEAAPLRQLIYDLCKEGLQALYYIESKQTPAEDWLKETAALFDRADKPQAEVLVAITPLIRKLVEAAEKQAR